MPIYFRNTPLTEPFTFDSIGNHWVQDSISRPKGYPHYHYLQTEHGCGKIRIQENEYILNPDEGILIAPFLQHSYSPLSKSWKTSFFTITGILESSISKIIGNQQIIFTTKEQGKQIQRQINQIIKKYESSPGDANFLSVDCYGLLMHFVNGAYIHGFTNDPLYQRYVNPVLKEIELHYSSELTIQNLSNSVYITPQYLSRLFRRFLKCSPYEYLTNYRINKAKEFLLLNPQMEVQEISQRSGFLDSSHFIFMFKKITGFTPLEFRKLN